MLLVIVARHGLHVHYMDVKTAFLYGGLEEEIYIGQPGGNIDDDGLVYRLQKSLYGLKQAPASSAKSSMRSLSFTALRNRHAIRQFISRQMGPRSVKKPVVP